MIARVRVDLGLVDVSLERGFTRGDLAVVRALPGRRWDPERSVWVVPEIDDTLAALRAGFGEDRVVVEDGEESTAPGEAHQGILDRVREGLLVRGYSPNTRKVYLGHLRRFLAWCGGGEAIIPDDPERTSRAYLLHLVEERHTRRIPYGWLLPKVAWSPIPIAGSAPETARALACVEGDPVRRRLPSAARL